MTLTLKNREEFELEKEYSRSIISANFTGFMSGIEDARVRKDGFFYEVDYRRMKRWIDFYYSILTRRVEKEDFMDEEHDLLLRSVDTMTAEQFTALAKIILHPYMYIKADDFV